MILVELAPCAAIAHISASNKPITIQPLNMQRFTLTTWQRPKTQASFRSAAIKITCKEVIDKSDADEDAIVIPWSKIEGQFNTVKECHNLFPKTIPTELPPLGNVNHGIYPE